MNHRYCSGLNLASPNASFADLQKGNLPLLVLEIFMEGSLAGAAVWRLPLAQGAILETDVESHVGFPVHGACFSLCLCLCLCVCVCVCMCDYHKKKEEKKRNLHGNYFGFGVEDIITLL